MSPKTLNDTLSYDSHTPNNIAVILIAMLQPYGSKNLNESANRDSNMNLILNQSEHIVALMVAHI